MARQSMILWKFLLLIFMMNVWCTIIIIGTTAATTVTPTPDSKAIKNGHQYSDMSPYINLMLCPLELQPWNCAGRESRHILDNWDNELYIQWNKLKDDADHQLYITSDRRGYKINEYYTEEKPSTILRKIEIGVNYMKRYLAETLNGFLGREVNYHRPIIRRHKLDNNNESWPRLLLTNKMNNLQKTKKINKKVKENLDNTSYNITIISKNESLDITAKRLPLNNKTVETMNEIESSNQLQNNKLYASNKSYNNQRDLYKNYEDVQADNDEQHTLSDTTLNEDSSEIEYEKLPNDKKHDFMTDGGFDSKHTKIMKFSRSSGVQRGKKKKKKKAIIKLMLLGSFLKAKIELLLKIFSAGLQVKFFGIALIGLLINIARFWIDLKRGSSQKVVFVEHAHHQHHYDDHGDDWEVGGGGYWKRSLQMDSSFNNTDQEIKASQDMAYRNQQKRK